MKITIHRGIDQIGGCITEISSDTTRIIIDLGQNLPDGNNKIDDKLANKKAVSIITQNIDAIFYTHYHGDHIGLFHLVPDNIPQYIGSVAKQVVLCKHKRLSYIPDRKDQSKIEISIINKMHTFSPKQIIKIGDITIIPYFVSHSACDAYMFLIEANGKRVLHTGDFRGHGYLSKGLLPTIKKHIISKGKIDFLITEGTMLSRLDERVKHEIDLKTDAIKLMKQYKYTFVFCSSTDMERLATFYSANKHYNDRLFVCDDYQENILNIFSKTSGKISTLFDFGKPYTFNIRNKKLLNWMQDKGFCMLVRPTMKFSNYLKFILPIINHDKTTLIYSMWHEYINPKSIYAKKDYLDFVDTFPRYKTLHTSGHASADFLAEVCNNVNPVSGTIPIHSESSANFQNLPINDSLKSKIITSTQVSDNIEVEIK